MQNDTHLRSNQEFEEISLTDSKYEYKILAFSVIFLSILLPFLFCDDPDSNVVLLILIEYWYLDIPERIFNIYLRNKAWVHSKQIKNSTTDELKPISFAICGTCGKIIGPDEFKRVIGAPIKPFSITSRIKFYFCKSCYKKIILREKPFLLGILCIFYVFLLSWFYFSFDSQLDQSHSILLIAFIIFEIILIILIIFSGPINHFRKFRKIYN